MARRTAPRRAGDRSHRRRPRRPGPAAVARRRPPAGRRALRARGPAVRRAPLVAGRSGGPSLRAGPRPGALRSGRGARPRASPARRADAGRRRRGGPRAVAGDDARGSVAPRRGGGARDPGPPGRGLEYAPSEAICGRAFSRRACTATRDARRTARRSEPTGGRSKLPGLCSGSLPNRMRGPSRPTACSRERVSSWATTGAALTRRRASSPRARSSPTLPARG